MQLKISAPTIALLLIITTSACSPKTRYTPRPIPNGETARTWKDMADKRVDFVIRTLLPLSHPSEQDIITTYANYINDNSIVPDWESLHRKVLLAKTNGSQSIALDYISAVCLKTIGRNEEAESAFMPLADKLPKDAKHIWVKYFCSVNVAEYHPTYFADGRTHYTKQGGQVLRLIPALCNSQIYDEGEERLLMGDLQRAFQTACKDREDEAAQAIAGIKGISPWIVEILSGMEDVELAWDARGEGWANSVTKEGRKRFLGHLDQAREHFEAAIALRPDYPEPYSKMIPVAMANPREDNEWRMWFDRAVERQMDYGRAYSALEWALRPRWRGSYDALYAFGLECLQTERFDTSVPYEFINVLLALRKDMGGLTALGENKEIYANARQCFEGYMKTERHPLAGQRDYDRTLYAIFAWAAKDYKRANILFSGLGESVSTWAFGQANLDQKTVIGESVVLGGEYAHVFHAALTDLENGNIERGKKRLESIQRKSALNPHGKLFLKTMIGMANTRSKLMNGEWIDFQPEADFSGWQVHGAKWLVEKDGTLLHESIDGGRPASCLFQHPLANYEITGEVEFSEAEWTQAGIILGWSDAVTEETPVFHIFRENDFRTVAVSRKFTSEKKYKSAQVELHNTFRVVVRDRKISGWLNGKQFFNEYEAPASYWGRNEPMIGLGAYSKKGVQVRFRNIKLRTLDGNRI
jgi:hypothetical protein